MRVMERLKWTQQLPKDQADLYGAVLGEARRRGLRFAIGGGFACNAYTGIWRNTKDLDLFVLQQDRQRFVQLLTDLGFHDYYDEKPYDRAWIYRGIRGDQIVDIIWEMANHRASVDEIWLQAGPDLEFQGACYPLIPPEETLWTKLYVLQRERCDWPDALNILSARGTELDWRRLLERLGPDIPLLRGVLGVFPWLCPRRARELPGWLWNTLRIPPPDGGDETRAELLDSRPWMVNPC